MADQNEDGASSAAAAASAPGLVTHSQKLHLQLEHKCCRNSFYQSFSLPRSLDVCVVSSCLRFSRHLESKANNTSHCSWFRTDNKEKNPTNQQQNNSLERNITTELKASNSFQSCGGLNRKKGAFLHHLQQLGLCYKNKALWLHLHLNKNDIKKQASEFLSFFYTTLSDFSRLQIYKPAVQVDFQQCCWQATVLTNSGFKVAKNGFWFSFKLCWVPLFVMF